MTVRALTRAERVERREQQRAAMATVRQMIVTAAADRQAAARIELDRLAAATDVRKMNRTDYQKHKAKVLKLIARSCAR